MLLINRSHEPQDENWGFPDCDGSIDALSAALSGVSADRDLSPELKAKRGLGELLADIQIPVPDFPTSQALVRGGRTGLAVAAVAGVALSTVGLPSAQAFEAHYPKDHTVAAGTPRIVTASFEEDTQPIDTNSGFIDGVKEFFGFETSPDDTDRLAKQFDATARRIIAKRQKTPVTVDSVDDSMTKITTPAKGIAVTLRQPDLPPLPQFVSDLTDQFTTNLVGETYVKPIAVISAQQRAANRLAANRISSVSNEGVQGQPSSITRVTSKTQAKTKKLPAAIKVIRPSSVDEVAAPIVGDPSKVDLHIQDKAGGIVTAEAPTGTPVTSMVDSEVMSIRDLKHNRDSGSLVMLRDLNDNTRYSLSGMKYGSVDVEAGDTVKANQIVGSVGSKADNDGVTPGVTFLHLPAEIDNTPIVTLPITDDLSSLPLYTDTAGKLAAAQTAFAQANASHYKLPDAGSLYSDVLSGYDVSQAIAPVTQKNRDLNLTDETNSLTDSVNGGLGGLFDSLFKGGDTTTDTSTDTSPTAGDTTLDTLDSGANSIFDESDTSSLDDTAPHKQITLGDLSGDLTDMITAAKGKVVTAPTPGPTEPSQADTPPVDTSDKTSDNGQVDSDPLFPDQPADTQTDAKPDTTTQPDKSKDPKQDVLTGDTQSYDGNNKYAAPSKWGKIKLTADSDRLDRILYAQQEAIAAHESPEMVVAMLDIESGVSDGNTSNGSGHIGIAQTNSSGRGGGESHADEIRAAEQLSAGKITTVYPVDHQIDDMIGWIDDYTPKGASEQTTDKQILAKWAIAAQGVGGNLSQNQPYLRFADQYIPNAYDLLDQADARGPSAASRG